MDSPNTQISDLSRETTSYSNLLASEAVEGVETQAEHGATTPFAPPHSVCIIGAGIAGLAAARLLEEAQIPYIVYEGGDRIGGRVFPFQHEDGFLQHGATFINGDQNPIYAIAARLGLVTKSVGDFDAFGDISDLLCEGGTIEREVLDEFTAFITPLEEGYRALAEREPEATVGKLFARDFEAFVNEPGRARRRRAFEALARFYLSFFEMEWAANVEQLSLANFTQWDDGTEDGLSSFCLDKNGYRAILDALLAPIPRHRIHLNCIVTNVDYTNGNSSVVVSLADNSKAAFSSVIVTASLGHLKRFSAALFTPPLPKRKLAAIHALGFGDMQKLFLSYARPFWPADKQSFQTAQLAAEPCSLLGRGSIFEVIDWEPKTLVLWLSGRAVATAASMTDTEIAERVTTHLRAAFRDPDIPYPEKMYRHSWHSSPVFLGSYSYLTPAAVALGNANDALAEPICADGGERPLVMFAGEATHPSIYQTAVGAFYSGEREATRVIAAFRDGAGQDQSI